MGFLCTIFGWHGTFRNTVLARAMPVAYCAQCLRSAVADSGTSAYNCNSGGKNQYPSFSTTQHLELAEGTKPPASPESLLYLSLFSMSILLFCSFLLREGKEKTTTSTSAMDNGPLSEQRQRFAVIRDRVLILVNPFSI